MSNEATTRETEEKRIDVVNAIVIDDGRLLAMQRGFGSQAGGWEFPGGKVEDGEDPEAALVRSIGEKLDVPIEVNEFAFSVEVEHDGIAMHTRSYLCHIPQGKHPHLQEHTAARWLERESLHNVGWLPSDARIVEVIVERGIL